MTKSSQSLCLFKDFDYFCIKSYLTVKQRKTQRVARLPSRYHYFSDTPLNVYSSNGYVKPFTI